MSDHQQARSPGRSAVDPRPDRLNVLPQLRDLALQFFPPPALCLIEIPQPLNPLRESYRRARRTTLLPQLSLALAQLAGSPSTWAAEQGDYPALPPADQAWPETADHQPDEFAAEDDEPDPDRTRDIAHPDQGCRNQPSGTSP